MANTYTQIYVHIVFSVWGRQSMIRKQWKERLHKYITGIIKNDKQKLLAINSMPDHIHLLIGMKPDIALSDLIRDVKSNSSKFINAQRLLQGRFNWQEGFGAFSYSHSQLDKVIMYIQNQERHHAKKSFHREYLEILKKYDIDYNEKYVFQSIEKAND